jgi:hypothetical protein
MFNRLQPTAGVAFIGALLLAGLNHNLGTQEQLDRELTAHARILPGVSAGVKALRRDVSGRYYVLGSDGQSVRVYAPDGRPLGPVPPTINEKTPPIVFAEDFDVDAAGNIYFADRGGNAVKVLGANGRLQLSIPVAAPLSVTVLPAGEVAVVSMKGRHLVQVFDLHGKALREFGDLFDLAEHEQLNHLLNAGRLATDAADHIYFAFEYVPEPTIRKYDRYGYAAQEIALSGLKYGPAAQAARREISQQDERNGSPLLRPTVTAIGVDPQTQELWASIGPELLQFSPDGTRRVTYRAYTAEGVRVDAAAMVIEPQRLLLVSSSVGIFEFTRPAKLMNASP